MIRALVTALLVASLPAQAPEVDGLLAMDWRKRNEAALTLARGEVPDVAGLIRVLQTDWKGEVEIRGRYGGRPPKASDLDPVLRMLHQLRMDLIEKPSPWPPEMLPPRDAADLVVVWHPHQLALWLLTSRPSARAEAASALANVPRHGVALQRAWLSLAQPEPEALVRMFQDDEGGWSLADVLNEAAPRWDDVLRAGLARGSADGRGGILALGRPELVSTPEAMAGVVDLFATAKDTWQYKRAGWTLMQLGAQAVPVLASRLADAGEGRLRVLGMLSLLSEHAAAAAIELEGLLDSEDREVHLLALAALRNAQLPEPIRRQLASRLLAWIKPGKGKTGMFVIDVLGNLGDAADAAVLAALKRCIERPPHPGADARALGSLHRLQRLPALPLETVRRIAAHPLANLGAWLALADRGEAAASLAPEGGDATYVEELRWRDREIVARRLAVTAPDLLRTWLREGQSPRVRMAIVGLRSLAGGDQVPSADLAGALGMAKFDNAARLCEWLGERSDAAEHADVVLAATLRLSAERSFLPFAAGVSLYSRLVGDQGLCLKNLEPVLSRGHCLVDLQNQDVGLLRGACERWLGETSDEGVQDRLVAELVRLGWRGEAAIAAVRRVIAGQGGQQTLNALATRVELVDAVLAELVQRMERDIGQVTPAYAGNETAHSLLLAKARR
jgi:hypothetical protein